MAEAATVIIFFWKEKKRVQRGKSADVFPRDGIETVSRKTLCLNTSRFKSTVLVVLGVLLPIQISIQSGFRLTFHFPNVRVRSYELFW